MEKIHIYTKEPGLDLDSALSMAKTEASLSLEEPMLLSWHEKKSGRFSPNVTCCGLDEPAWIVYAKNRGARVNVNVNQGEYVFMFR
ncbi:MAG: AF1514 family protein [Deltaproteobacteria bacterium]|nr:AF1514 family protein [Deltaproteobacteria bacterium]MBW2052938.1 AF1514 family protein [Deltaproteobacteria bacterium]MBW2141640.1 AF1514 family protein [Deltaproteobacteria bacterium]